MFSYSRTVLLSLQAEFQTKVKHHVCQGPSLNDITAEFTAESRTDF